MIGVWIGKVRSTPTPKLTFRTVKVSRTPPPWRRMTTPWKTWIRSRLPSRTRTWTLTVSPGRNSGTSLRREAASIESRVCMVTVLAPERAQARSMCFGRRLSTVPQQAGRRKNSRSAEQVGPVLLGAPQRLLPAPPLDRGVVSGDEHAGHVQTAPGRRPSVGRRLEEAAAVRTVRKRLLDDRRRIAHESRQQPSDGLDDDERRDLSAGEHVVAERDLVHAHPAPGVLGHPRVDALVTSAGDHEMTVLRPRLSVRLGEQSAGRGRQHEPAVGLLAGRQRVERPAPWLRRHDHPGTAAVRRVVDGAVRVVGPLPEVVHPHVEQAPRPRLAQQRDLERREVVREDRDDVDEQRCHHRRRFAHHSSNRPSGGSTTTVRASRSTVGTISRTNGISSSAPSGRRTTSRSLPGGCRTSVTVPRGERSVAPAAGSTRSWSQNSSSSVDGLLAESTTRRVLRNASAAVRSDTPANATSNRPECQRARSTVSGPLSAGSVSMTEPGANRTSGASVRTSTATSPPMPWARAMRPTTSCTEWVSANLVDVDEVDADAAAAEGGHHRAQSARSATATADDLAEVVRVHADLQDLTTPEVAQVDLHLVGVLDDAPDEVLERLFEHQPAVVSSPAGSAAAAPAASVGAGASALSAAGSAAASVASAASSAAGSAAGAASAGASSVGAASAAGASAASALSASGFAAAFLADAFLVVAGLASASRLSLAAASKMALRSGRGAAVLTPSVGAGSPLNFSPSPGALRVAATGSVGWAPTPSQYCARSESTSMKEGSSFGWYLPIVSITRPSRLVRESATTMR